MELRRLPAEESAVRRYVEDLWLPYHRDLEAAVDAHALAEDADLVAEETAFRLDRLDEEGYRLWIAVDGGDDRPLAETDGAFVGFVSTELERSPSVFGGPDRLRVGDLYVAEPYRGTGLARGLVERAAADARERECAQLTLDVDVDNERAIAFYEKLGFEPYRRELVVDAADL